MKLERLIPMLPVKNLRTSIDFYQKLGFDVEQQNDEWGWAMVRLDDGRLMLDQSIHQPGPAPRPIVIYLYPDDVVEYHRQVRERGLATPDLNVTFYGMTEFRLLDPDGNQLWIGQRSSGHSMERAANGEG